MELQHLFLDSTVGLSRQGCFQWTYSLRAAGTPEIRVRPCLYILAVETQTTITRRNRVRRPEELGNNKEYNTATG